MAAEHNCANGRFASFRSWSTDINGDHEPSADELWREDYPSLPSRHEVRHRDHVCRPVIIGSDGRAIPVVLDYPPLPISRQHDDQDLAKRAQEYFIIGDSNFQASPARKAEYRGVNDVGAYSSWWSGPWPPAREPAAPVGGAANSAAADSDHKNAGSYGLKPIKRSSSTGGVADGGEAEKFVW